MSHEYVSNRPVCHLFLSSPVFVVTCFCLAAEVRLCDSPLALYRGRVRSTIRARLLCMGASRRRAAGVCRAACLL